MAYLLEVLSRGGLLEREGFIEVGWGGGTGVIDVIEMCNIV